MALPMLDLPKDVKISAAPLEGDGATSSLLPCRYTACISTDAIPTVETLAAATVALLFKYTQQDEIAVGVDGIPISDRVQAAPGQAAGCALAILSIANASERTLESLEQAADMAVRGDQAGDIEQKALQVVVVDGNAFPELLDQPTCIESLAKTATVQLELKLLLSGRGITWCYRPGSFSKEWISRAHRHLETMCRADPLVEIRNLSLTSVDESYLVLHTFNRTSISPASTRSVLEAVDSAVRSYPERTAIDTGSEQVSYKQLWAMAGRLASAIRSADDRRNPSIARPVAVLLDRGVYMIASLLGVWRSGGACMPVDVRTPEQRIKSMLLDAEVRVAICRSSLSESLAGLPCKMVLADQHLSNSAAEELGHVEEPRLSGDHAAYVLFTSGSTGVPKGVNLTHRNLLAYIGWHVPYYGLSSEDAVPHLAGLSFDASMAEIWPTLCTGGRVLPALDDNIRLIPGELCKWFANMGVTVAFLTTQLAEGVLSESEYPANLKLRILFTGGDKLHFGPSEGARFDLVNIYGPTECTVNVTMCLVPKGSGPPSIGQPVPGSQIYILDPQMRPQPPGIYGELYIGGPQVGPGYLARPELTSEKFVPNPFRGHEVPASTTGPTRWPTGPLWENHKGPKLQSTRSNGTGLTFARSLVDAQAEHGGTLYRTGDLVRWDETGSLDFLGRADCQVKIRGQRIELAEIEARLLEHTDVKECCVICREVKVAGTADKYLVAYWAPVVGTALDRNDKDNEALTSWLRSTLPAYMVPSAFVKMSKLPVNANGKVDRKVLPEPSFDTKEAEAEEKNQTQPEGVLEERLQLGFDTILGCNGVSVTRSFFDLGGHSLSVGRLVNWIRKEVGCEVKIQDIFEHSSVRDLASLFASRGVSGTATAASDIHKEQSDVQAKTMQTATSRIEYAASFQQAALYSMSEISTEASVALNIAFCCHVRGALDVNRLQRAFSAVAMRHDAFRSIFKKSSDGLTCVVQSRDCLDFKVIDIATYMPGDSSKARTLEEKSFPEDPHVHPNESSFVGSEWLLDMQYDLIDLHRGPLCRVRVAQEDDDQTWILHWTLHHACVDLWSYTVLLDELAFAYDFLKDAAEVTWPREAPQYRTCAQAQDEWCASAAGRRAMEFWKSKLDPAPPVLELPTFQKSKVTGFRGSRVDFEMESELLVRLNAVGRSCGASSAYPVLLSAWMVLLSRHAQEEDVCVGAPMACRTTTEAETAVGYFVNPLCVRATVQGDFDALVRHVAHDAIESLEHQQCSLSTVCEQLGLEERLVLQGMFVFETCPNEAYAKTLPSFFMGHQGAGLPFGNDLRLESLGLGQRHAQFDIALMLACGPLGELIGNFQYNSVSFKRESVLRLQAQYRRVLEAVALDPKQDVNSIQLFGADDIKLLQLRAATPWPAELPNASLSDLFTTQADANPSAFALVTPEGTHTYGEVLNRAEQVAAALQQPSTFSTSPNDSPSLNFTQNENPLVGMMVDPGKWMVAGPLGAWMAGRGYFPLDPSLPIERLEQMTQDAAPQCIMCERKHATVARGLGNQVVILEDLASKATVRRRASNSGFPSGLKPSNRALLIFTSGSTGRPKGVLLPMKALLSHVLFDIQHFHLKAGQTVLQHTAWTFDAHMCEMWPALLVGGTVVISKREGSKDFAYLTELVDKNRVNHALFVPSLLAELLEHQQLPRSLRSVAVVGEQCSLSLAGRILEAPLTLNNFYGPSEGGIGATIYSIDNPAQVPPGFQSLPIGRPVSWRQIILLDAQLSPAVGRAGQMAILGEGLALGYLNLPDETRKKFHPTPPAVRSVFPEAGPILYLTGDVGRYCQDNLLEFVGRLDNQVKLRGQRIELGEVEATLLSAAAVTEAVAVVHGDRLIAYYSTRQTTDDGSAAAQCTEKIKQRLPRYMWPELMHISEWPRGRTGKVDRKALPIPTVTIKDIVAPRNDLEQKLLELFCLALRRDTAITSVDADFFALGGTSLKAASLLTMLRAEIPAASNIQFNEFYAHPSPASLAATLVGSDRDAMPLVTAPAEGLLPASFGQEHMLILHELQPSSGAYNSPLLLRLDGDVDQTALAEAMHKVVARHDVLRTNLLRDTIDGEFCAAQVTTPAAEFKFIMEYWPAPGEMQGNSYPVQMPLNRSRPRGLSRIFARRSSGDIQGPPSNASGTSLPSPVPSPGASAYLLSSSPVPSSMFGRRHSSRGVLRQGNQSPFPGYASPPLASPRRTFQNWNSNQNRTLQSPDIQPAVSSPKMAQAQPLLPSHDDSAAEWVLAFDLDASESSLSVAPNFVRPNRPLATSDQSLSVVESALMQFAEMPFDLRDQSLIRVVLAKVSEGHHLLLVNLHHSITDGRSNVVLSDELSKAYNALISKDSLDLPKLPVQYADYAYSQRQWMAQGELDQQLGYWRRQLEGLQSLQLPCDFPRPAKLPLDGAEVLVEIPPSTVLRLGSLARAGGATMFSVLLAAFACVLGRWSGSLDVAVASVVSIRDAPEVEALIGYFVNTVILRAKLAGSFEQLVRQVFESSAGAFANATAPFASVLEAAKLESAVVPALFVLQDAEGAKWEMEGLRMEEVQMPRRSALFDVTLELQQDSTGGISGVLVYNTSLWNQSRALRFSDSFQALLAAAVASPADDLSQLKVMPEGDRLQVLQWGRHNEKAAIAKDVAPSCLSAFQAQLTSNAKRPAIIHGDRVVTYDEFGSQVAALRAELHRNLAPGKESVVGILMGRSIEMAVAIWATLWAHAAYVPIDPEYPAERISHILENSKPELLLCQKEHEMLGSGIKALVTEDWPKANASGQMANDLPEMFAQVSPSQLAYVIYTSGSTGRPKGVAVEHGAVANMVREQIRLMKIVAEDRVLQFFKPAFDGAVQEYLSTPCAGAALVLWNAGDDFGDVMREQHVTTATLTPSALTVLEVPNPEKPEKPESRIPNPKLKAFTKIAVAAEACPPALVNTWAGRGRQLLNAYGPSECCVVSTFAPLEGLMTSAPIGRPLKGMTGYVFEPVNLKSLQPIGVSGELCLGGVQLARGYYGDDAKTTEKFIKNPLDGSRMYRSGDLVSWLSDGQLVYLGRNDEMVKVRGFRVELTEVEAALAEIGAQTVAVSLNVSKDGLWAWVTPETLSASQLKDQLQKKLPQYMVPQKIFTLNALPLTPNGKIDKKLLLADASAWGSAEEDVEEFVTPESSLEKKICAIVAKVLGLDCLGMMADLKASGLSSLKTVLLSQRLRDAGFDVPLGNLYELKTVDAITKHIAAEHRPESFISASEDEVTLCRRCVAKPLGCVSTIVNSVVMILMRILVWTWISGVVIWPAVGPLWVSSRIVLPKYGLLSALAWLILAAYPLYMAGVILLVVVSKWIIIGRYKPTVVSTDSCYFFRWWTVDRLFTFTNDTVLGAFRGGALYFGYLKALGMRAKGYSRLDTRFVSEFDLIQIGRRCVVADGAKLRPAFIEAGMLHLRPIVFGDECSVGENAVVTAGSVAGDDVTLQPLSFCSGRTGRTLPDHSVWKGSPLVQSRHQRIRPPAGQLLKDLANGVIALLLSLILIICCSAVGYCVFGTLATAQGIPWQWQNQPEGWLFAAVWLLFGPPVMASADVILGYDLAQLSDDTAAKLGDTQLVFALRIAFMVVLSYAAFGWSLTLSSALLGRVLRGSRFRNESLYQVRRLLLRFTFPRYPAQLSGTAGMPLYLKLLGGDVAFSATVISADPPLEPRKLHIAEEALVMNALALGECSIGKRSLVGGGAVMLPHAEVQSHAVVGAMSVVENNPGRPVRSHTALVSNPGIIVSRAELSNPPRRRPVTECMRPILRVCYPVLAPMLLQLLLLLTLLPVMYFLTVVMNVLLSYELSHQSTLTGMVILSLTLAPVYLLLGWCLCLIMVILKWLLLGKIRPAGPWRWHGSPHHYIAAFVQSLYALSAGVYVSMAFGSPLYNWWLRMLGTRVSSDALVLTPVTDFDVISIGSGAVIDKEAAVSGTRLLPSQGGPSEFATCFGNASIGPHSTISHSAAVVAADTAELSVLAPLSALGTTMRLPARTMAVGSPPQKFVWSKDRDNLIKPSTRPVPRELRHTIRLPQYVRRAISRMKVLRDSAAPEVPEPLVTGANGFLGRYIVAALLEATDGNVLCLVRGTDLVVARARLLDNLHKAGVSGPSMTDRVVAVLGDVSSRSFGLSITDFQRLAGRATHVFNSAAKVNLAEPFDMMKKDNVDGTTNILEFCCAVRPKPLHHISTMGVLTPDMLDRHGEIAESTPLGDMRTLPMYGTGDQANGYPYTKWLSEKLVFEAGRKGLPVFVHRPGLIGGHSKTGAMAQDVFFHFLSDVVKISQLPAMEGNKFNLTPVDWVSKTIVHIALTPRWTSSPGSTFHPAASNNTVTMSLVADVLRSVGYQDMAWRPFAEWRDAIVADPQKFKSWSFCAALTAEGNGIDSMAGNSNASEAMREAIGSEALSSFDPRALLEQMLRFCHASGLLPQPVGSSDNV